MTDAVQGGRDVESFFETMPKAAQDELGRVLRQIGNEVLALQRSLAPVQTGALRQSLSVEEELGKLRVKAGLLGVERQDRAAGNKIMRDIMAGRTPVAPRDYGTVFYGIIQEYGRKAQDVWVTRGIKAGEVSVRRNGARAMSIRKPYLMHVRAMPGRHFVHVESQVDAIAEKYLTPFWNDVAEKAGAGMPADA